LAVNEKLGVVSLVGPAGPAVIVVSGGVVSFAGAEVTVIALTVVALSPSASATVTRTFLVPAFWKVNDIVLPLPSGQSVPPWPSLPSSTQV
jgi:hypothetical protein